MGRGKSSAGPGRKSVKDAPSPNKPGRPRKNLAGTGAIGKTSKKRQHCLEASKLAVFKRNIGGWSTSLRNRAGEIIEYGASRMLLFMIANMVNNAVYSTMALMKDTVSAAFGEVHRLTGVALTTIKEKWFHWTTRQEVSIGDAANRGAGAETIEDLRQLSPAHYAETERFIDVCNSRAGPGKVTLNEIQKHMRESAPEPLRVNIPRSSLRLMLTKHMGFEYAYTKKKGILMKGEVRHARIRKFVIELYRALKKQESGEYVVVFTDETYIHQNHSPLMSWVRAEDHSVGKTTSKGKRLIVLHATTTDGFICMRDEKGFPIGENGMSGETSIEKTAEWIWQVRARARRARAICATSLCMRSAAPN
jgi:hypothetical protein